MLASQEVRWFFDGPVDANHGLKRWVETSDPLKRDKSLSAPKWKGRLDEEPDIYLLVPHYADMGIKWREGQLQIKGLHAALGRQLFKNGHIGAVERWSKWSYKGASIQDAFKDWFKQNDPGPVMVSVTKTRCQRKVRMDPLSGQLQEVDADTPVDRGSSLEVADLKVGAASYCSVAFETFPDDSQMHACFTRLVDCFLEVLDDVKLSESHSMSYPAWLRSLRV